MHIIMFLLIHKKDNNQVEAPSRKSMVHNHLAQPNSILNQHYATSQPITNPDSQHASSYSGYTSLVLAEHTASTDPKSEVPHHKQTEPVPSYNRSWHIRNSLPG